MVSKVVLFWGVVGIVGFSFCLFGLWLLLSVNSLKDREKLSPYECGFDTILSSRSSFSLRFFLVAVIFVVFDVEIVLLVPIVYTLGVNSTLWSLFGSCSFICLLILGLFHEWREGSLDWVAKEKK